jgi:MFS family permease
MEKMFNLLSSLFIQILATLAVSLGPFAAGLGKGYSSPALASLQSLNALHQHHHQHQTRGHWGGGGSNSSTTPIRAMAGGGFSVSNQEGSWIASLSLLGALFGGPLGGVAMRYGRKRTLLAIAIPFSFFWLLTASALPSFSSFHTFTLAKSHRQRYEVDSAHWPKWPVMSVYSSASVWELISIGGDWPWS